MSVRPRKIYRRDEEPDWADDPDHWTPHEYYEGVCAFCGNEGHVKPACPNRPTSDVKT